MSNRVYSLIFLLCSCSCFIVSCGGSGSSDSPAIETPIVTLPPERFNLSVNTTYLNECGVMAAHPDSQVFVHDENWEVIDSKAVDQNGIAEFSFDEDTQKPIAIVSYTGPRADPNSTINVQTIYDAPNQRINVSAPYSPSKNTNCECIEGTVEFMFPTDGEMLLSSSHRPGEITLIQDNLYSIQACKTNDNWLPIYVTFNNSGTDNAYATILKELDALESGSIVIESVDFKGVDLFVPTVFNDYTIAMKYEHINTIIDTGTAGGSFIVFQELLGDETALFNVSGNEFARYDDLQVLYSNQKFTKDFYDVNSLQKLRPLPLAEELDSLSFTENREYDFRDFTDMPVVSFKFAINLPGSMKRVYIEHLSSLTGSLPSLETYSKYTNELTNISEMYVELRFQKYGDNIQDIGDLLSSLEDTGPISTSNYERHVYLRQEFIVVRWIPVFK